MLLLLLSWVLSWAFSRVDPQGLALRSIQLIIARTLVNTGHVNRVLVVCTGDACCNDSTADYYPEGSQVGERRQGGIIGPAVE